MKPTLKHFTEAEFACKCGCGGGFKDMNPQFLAMLDLARARAKVPFNLTSAYRCPTHNRNSNGVTGSAHVQGYACDIACSNDKNRFLILKALLDTGFNRIGLANNFIHVDNDPDKPQGLCFLYA